MNNKYPLLERGMEERYKDNCSRRGVEEGRGGQSGTTEERRDTGIGRMGTEYTAV